MPGKFKTSEYKENFKWLASPKSATFHPSPEQAATIAGLNSAQLTGLQAEPALQRRAKPLLPATTSTTKMFDEDVIPPADDYMLLGSQEKFASNVAYRNMAAAKTKAGQTYYRPRRRLEADSEQHIDRANVVKELPVDASTSTAEDSRADRPPRVKVDTGARPRAAKVLTSANGAVRKEHAAVAATRNVVNDSVMTKDGMDANRPRNGRAETQPSVQQIQPYSVGQRTVLLAPSQRADRKKDVGASKVDHQSLGGNKNNNSSGDTEDNPSQAVDEKASSTYAFKYKAGIAQARPAKKRKSEYMTQFDWKKPVIQAPVLAAEQLVHNSNLPINPPPKRSAAVPPPKESEYSRQFKSWLPYYKPVTQEETTTGPSGVNKLRRAKSETSLTPDRRPPSESPAKVTAENKRLTDSLNPQRPFFPHGKLVRWHSEYMANYRPFEQFKYDAGAWRGAAPPHVLYSGQPKAATEEGASKTSSSWLAEVQELRKRAEEYRKRALGTHFSREHTAQLLAEQSRLWDEVSTNSTASTLSLQQNSEPVANGGSPISASEDRLRNGGKNNENSNNNADDVDSDSDKPQTRSDRRGKRDVPIKIKEASGRKGLSEKETWRKQAWDMANRDLRATPSDSVKSVISGSVKGSSSTTESSSLGGEGRVPTPELRSSPILRRHHLDITTPSKGGALLVKPQRPHTSPVKAAYDAQRKNSNVNTAVENGGFSRTIVPSIDEGSSIRSATSPTYGKRTVDTHVLLDEDASHDEILETRYVHSPQQRSSREQLSKGNKVSSKMTEKVHLRDVGIGDRELRDDDEVSLSTSLRSVASSSSLASEVLERARARRDEFWGDRGRGDAKGKRAAR